MRNTHTHTAPNSLGSDCLKTTVPGLQPTGPDNALTPNKRSTPISLVRTLCSQNNPSGEVGHSAVTCAEKKKKKHHRTRETAYFYRYGAMHNRTSAPTGYRPADSTTRQGNRKRTASANCKHRTLPCPYSLNQAIQPQSQALMSIWYPK